MGICETVKTLAEAVAEAKGPLKPRHQLQVEILRLMPLYAEIHDLCAWDSAFRRGLEEQNDESEVGRLLEEIFEFGCYNLCCAFRPLGTKHEFAALAELLIRSGVTVPTSPELADW